MTEPSPLRLARCFFCDRAPLGEYVLTNSAPVSLHDRQGGITRSRQVLPLCARCHAALKRAGSEGRLHRATSVRWWLGVH